MSKYIAERELVSVIGALRGGKVIAYPTEAVFGLGCDPDNQVAVETILALKRRSRDKGLILIAADYAQLQPYVDDSVLSEKQKRTLLATWPGAITWVMPARANTPYWLRGRFDTLAVRVSAHPIVRQLCMAFSKPLVSTSANLNGLPACRTDGEVNAQFGDQVILVTGSLGGNANPSEIRDAMTGKLIRQG